jgi:UDP-N-acetylmuramate--alanine ligase
MKACRLHFGGVAGIGMSALAQAMTTAKCKISGSDRMFDEHNTSDWQKSLCTRMLNQFTNFSVAVTPQDGSAINKDLNVLVISTAIEDSNPEVIKAKKLKIPILHRSEILSWYLAGFDKCIAVSGTCGKSSVTGMLGWVLECCGSSPTVVNGAPVINWVDDLNIGNFRFGQDSICVFEADESDKSLLRYEPDISIITNISADHFSKSEAEQVFQQFREQTKDIVFDEDSLLDLQKVECNGFRSTFQYREFDFEINVAGIHNIENALYVIETALYLGCNLEDIAAALKSFKGISKRLEQVGKTNEGSNVIIDFAHNPKKIQASLDAIKSCDNSAMFVVWRPHGYAPLRNMFNDLVDVFATALKENDKLFLLPVYDVGGTAERSISSDIFSEKLRKRGVNVRVGEDDEFRIEIQNRAKDDDVIIVMGARDPYLEVFARDLVS